MKKLLKNFVKYSILFLSIISINILIIKAIDRAITKCEHNLKINQSTIDYNDQIKDCLNF